MRRKCKRIDWGYSMLQTEAKDDADQQTMKHQRMARLIQMSLQFVGVNEPRNLTSNFRSVDPKTPSNHENLLQSTTTLETSSHTRSSIATRNIARKRTWTASEDAKLVDLVQRLGQNWAAIALDFPTRDRKRCRERYINHLNPTLLHTPWSSAEDEILLQRHGDIGSQWAQISDKLPDRSPDDVKNRWLQLTADEAHDNTPVRAKPQRWTVSETDALASLVDANGAKDWFFIASQIPGRTDLQCRQHWHRVLAPGIIKGPWKPSEDELLRAKVNEFGPQWEKIAAFLPGRRGKQCRERYLNHLDPKIVKTPWTAEENAILRTAFKRNPRKWTKIAQELPGRPENSIKNRWNSMRRELGRTSETDS